MFEQHCDADQMLTKNKLNGMFPFKAANAFNVDIKPDREEKLNFQNFLQLMQAESSIQKWTASLPICKIYADALTAVSSSDRDPLKAISTITNEELNAACDGCMDAIKGILADELRKLKAGFLLMDEKSHCQNESAAKFQVFTMSCGHIEDFHKGLIGRIGCLFPLNKIISICENYSYRYATHKVSRGHGSRALQQSWIKLQIHYWQLSHYYKRSARVGLCC